jgi:hypothetical protein
MNGISQYLKAIVALIGAIATGLQTAFPSDHWASTVTATLSAVLVYLVPNTPAPGAVAEKTPEKTSA